MESKQIWLMHIIILNLELGLSRACSTYHLISVKLPRLLIIVCLAWCQPSLVDVCLLRHASVTNSSLDWKKPQIRFCKFLNLSIWMSLQQKSRGHNFYEQLSVDTEQFLGGNSISILQCSHETDDVESAIFDVLKSVPTRVFILNVKVCFGSETGVILWSRWKNIFSAKRHETIGA